MAHWYSITSTQGMGRQEFRYHGTLVQYHIHSGHGQVGVQILWHTGTVSHPLRAWAGRSSDTMAHWYSITSTQGMGRQEFRYHGTLVQYHFHSGHGQVGVRYHGTLVQYHIHSGHGQVGVRYHGTLVQYHIHSGHGQVGVQIPWHTGTVSHPLRAWAGRSQIPWHIGIVSHPLRAWAGRSQIPWHTGTVSHPLRAWAGRSQIPWHTGTVSHPLRAWAGRSSDTMAHWYSITSTQGMGR